MLNSPNSHRIVILRHAQTTGGKSHAIGHTHLELSDEGKTCAHEFSLKIQELMAAQNIALYSSPSQRALESFGLVYKNSPEKIAIIPECQEIFLGEWEGLPFAEIKSQYPDLYEERGQNMAYFRPPNGENFCDVQNRMLKAISIICKDQSQANSPALVISHAGCIRTLLCHCLPLPLENIMQLKADNLHGIALDCDADGSIQLVAENINYLTIENYLSPRKISLNKFLASQTVLF